MKTLAQMLIGFVVVFSHIAFSQAEVMNYNDLQTYLPSSINGYNAGEPGGSTIEMQEVSFSSAEIEFTGNDGQFIKIMLMDYTEATSMYTMATAAMSSGLSFEDDVSKVQTFEFAENIIGWEEFRKKEKEAQIVLGIGNRFFLSIEANEQSNTDFIKEIAQNMEIEELATR